MYIEKLKDGRFRCHVQIKGKRKSAIWDKETEAKRWGKRTEAELQDAPPERKDFTFIDACEKYKAEISAKKEGGKWEILRLNAFARYFGDVLLADINQPAMAKWRDDRLKTVSGSTVQRERNLLSNVFTVAKNEWHWMDNKPFEGVSMPKHNDSRDSLYDWRKIRRILRFLGYEQGKKPETQYQQVALAFMIGCHTSLRASEILRVNKKNTLNEKTRVIGVKTKTLKIAHVPITKRALKVCRLADFTISAQMLDALFRKARDATMIGDYTFHDSRAFCLTMLARKVDVLTLSKISMHKDLKMLMKYYRETPEQIAGRL
jgi:integrase